VLACGPRGVPPFAALVANGLKLGERGGALTSVCSAGEHTDSPILNKRSSGMVPTGELLRLAQLVTSISPRRDVSVASRVACVACALVASAVGGAPSPTALGLSDNQSISVERAIRHQAELESLRYAARYALAYRTQNPEEAELVHADARASRTRVCAKRTNQNGIAVTKDLCLL
jgi:hypothetical protein